MPLIIPRGSKGGHKSAFLWQVLVGCRGGSVLLHELEQRAGGLLADPASAAFPLVRSPRLKPLLP